MGHRLTDSIHRVPSAALVDRSAYVVDLARGRRVIDVGFVDVGRMRAKREEGTWLHQRLHAVALELVGIDSNGEGVSLARSMGFEAYEADCQSAASLAALALRPAEVVVAGEILEHLDLPGAFLEALKVLIEPQGLLVLTTPNGISLTNFLGGLLGRELVNPDHVCWQSWHTAASLLGRHGWLVQQVAYYELEAMAPAAEDSFSHRMLTGVFRAYQEIAHPLFRVRPCLADGIILLALPPRPAHTRSER